MDALDVVRRVAAERDGIVTLEQARAAGLSTHEVQRFCPAGRWRVVARDSYLVDADLYDTAPDGRGSGRRSPPSDRRPRRFSPRPPSCTDWPDCGSPS